MADPKSQKQSAEDDVSSSLSSQSYEANSEQGASAGELLIEAARRNNTELLEEVIASAGNEKEVAELLNKTKTVLGNYVYHEAALRGSYDVIDILLDQDGFECDPITKREGDTPLHSAVRFINDLAPSESNLESATSLLNMMIEAGNDARIKNKHHLTPAMLAEADLPDDYAGSASDSDFDPEEYRRERERQKATERRNMI
ncbi:hypothetical protein B0O99DRAFT_507766 [Bisporella sp. PMI_857]|nr:hypothetical protein B0O99DRAFT_507766 [Bisporella sp. PMI_857]